MSDHAGKTMKTHALIARALMDNGVDTMFGLMGDGNMFMSDSYIRDCGGTFVPAAHEVGAALMALGYASVSGKVGVASVTHGPGFVNTMLALVQGARASMPMVLFTGDVPVASLGRLQDIDQREFALVAGAGFQQIRSPKTAARDVATALRRAALERRPIVLNSPVEFDFVDVEYQPVSVYIPETRAIVPASPELDNAVGIIAAARRPVVIAGRGAAPAEGQAALLRLAKRREAPVATTLKAKDLFEGEAYDLGISGVESSATTVEVMLESDCLLFFGASVTNATTSQQTFTKEKRIIQVNQEATEIGKFVAPAAGLVGDPAGMADLLVHWLDEAEIPPSGNYSDELRERIATAARPDLGPQADHGDGTVDHRHAIARLDRILPAERVLVTDGGRFTRGAWPGIRTPGPPFFVVPLDFGSIGLGLSHAIGAAYAAKGRTVVALMGDGFFNYWGISEFYTAVRGKLDLIVVIGNDGCYGSEHVKFARKDRDPGSSLLDWPDFAPVAVALGGEGVTVRHDSDWAEAERAIAARHGPLLIDVKLDPARITDED